MVYKWEHPVVLWYVFYSHLKLETMKHGHKESYTLFELCFRVQLYIVNGVDLFVAITAWIVPLDLPSLPHVYTSVFREMNGDIQVFISRDEYGRIHNF